MSKIMDALKQITPMIREMMLVDAIVELVDSKTRTVVAVARGEILDFDIKVGDPVTPGGVAEEALNTGKRQILERDSSFFGKPYVAVANPIFDEGELVGVITVGYSTAQRELLQEMAEDLFSFIQQFSSTMAEVSSAAESLSKSSTHIVQQTEMAAERVQETAEIVDFVKDISRKTQILGINASIEAARAGTHGRGFGVVAEEIQKLATHTQESAKTIEKTLAEMRTVFAEIDKSLSNAHHWTESQTESLRELNQVMDKLSLQAQQLLQIAKTVQM